MNNRMRTIERRYKANSKRLIGYKLTIDPNAQKVPSRGHLPCYRALVEATSYDGRKILVRPIVGQDDLGQDMHGRRRWTSLASVLELPISVLEAE